MTVSTKKTVFICTTSLRTAVFSIRVLPVRGDAQKKAMCDNMIPAYQQFRNWAEEFENASLETKKMIACQLFTRVETGKGYRVHIELNMTYRQFLEDWCSGTVIEAIAG